MTGDDWVAFPAAPARAKGPAVHERTSQRRFFLQYLLWNLVGQGAAFLVVHVAGIELSRLSVLLVALPVLLVVWLVLRRRPDPERAILADGSAWRVGERIREPEEVNRVVQIEIPRRGGDPELWLRFGPDRQHLGVVLLRAERAPVLDPAQREALVALLERAPVELPPAPHDPHDPNGRFSYMDRPNHLDRATAVELVRNPPVAGLGRRPDQRAGG